MKKIIFLLLLIIPASKLIAQDTLFYQNVEWSPDGKKICTEVIRYGAGNFTYEGYIISIAELKIERKIDGAIFPAWSPGGKWIAYTKRNDSKRGADIWLLDAVTGKTKMLNSDTSRTGGMCFSPNGKQICFSSDRDRKRNLYLMNIDGTDVQRITFDSVAYYNPAWSPGGNKIIYFRERGDQRDKVYAIDMANKKETMVTDDTLHNTYPGWFPDGKKICYTASDPHGKDPEARQIVMMDINGKHKHFIANTNGAFNARVSPDRKEIAFINGHWPQSQIYIANINGSNVICITCKLAGQ